MTLTVTLSLTQVSDRIPLGCTPAQAEKIISLRLYGSVDDLKKRLGQGKKKAGPAGLSPRMFGDCVDIYRGYGNVDQILKGCEQIGRELRKIIDSWTSRPHDKGKGKEALNTESGAIELVAVAEASSAKGFIKKPPTLLAPGVQLKDYQLTGISWLRLLHSKKYSCILADEMGKPALLPPDPLLTITIRAWKDRPGH